MVRLNIDDIDFSERECVVYGKGDKERKAYFDAKTKIHLLNYIESRTDNNIALFVSLNKPHSRLTESGVELRLREMGKKLGVEKVRPHKFRRTMATRAIEKGMPIEQVQKILGHEQIDTTLRYAMVNQNNVKLSHRKLRENYVENIFHRLNCNAKDVAIRKMEVYSMGKIATLNIRVNPDVKENAESVLAQLGIPMATAIDMYLKQISLVGGIPFSIVLPKAANSVNADMMSVTQIHQKLEKGYADIEKGNVEDAASAFVAFRERH